MSKINLHLSCCYNLQMIMWLHKNYNTTKSNFSKRHTANQNREINMKDQQELSSQDKWPIRMEDCFKENKNRNFCTALLN